ncbi:glycosyltransferase family 2 protein [Corynebacterium choanae]|nr:glycosyltransferase family 2 protein [Corynebacterium choanae]
MTAHPSTFPDTWLIIPCYNEGTVIGDVVAHARSVFPNIVVVDDGSADGSGQIAHRAGAHLVQHPVNLGQGAAIQTGIEYARRQPGAQYFCTFDADGQHQCADVVAMRAALIERGLDIIVGTRFGDHHREVDEVPWLKKLVLKTVVAFSPKTRRLGLTDAHNGLRVLNRTVADAINIRMNGMSHASEIISLIDAHGWRVGEHPVTILYTEYSKSKGQSLINGVNILADGIVARRL